MHDAAMAVDLNDNVGIIHKINTSDYSRAEDIEYVQPSAAGGGPMARNASGGDDSHLGEVNVELLGAENRDIGSAELVSRWREIVGDHANKAEGAGMAESASA